MRHSIRFFTFLALSLALAVPALAQSTHQHGAPADAAQTAPAADPAKVDLLHQEYMAKTAELHGKITAREADLETQLATNPDDTAAVKKLTAEIGTLRAQLFEQTTLFRIRYAKETGTPIRDTRGFGHKGGHGGMMMGGKGMEGGCMMMGKGGMMGMDMGKDGMMGKGMDMKGMDMGKGMDKNMPMPNKAAPADAGTAS